jgi:hypothetical protein
MPQTRRSASQLTSQTDEAPYRAALHRHLSADPAGEIDFFVNPRRFDLIQLTLGARLERRPLRILNVASGPFAFEHYFNRPDLQPSMEIDSFDLDGRLIALHAELVDHGMIAPSSFQTLDVASYKPKSLYDLVLINDLYYSKSVDFYETIGNLTASLAPGGLLYFDVQDERAGPLWRALGKDGAFRRYPLPLVRKKLEDLGLQVQSMTPAPSIKGGVDAFLRKMLWRGFGIANNFAFVARR